jgi:uncharacterized protein (UPF0276 family)
MGDYLLDTHDHPVCDAVWSLYRRAVEIFGPVSAMVEWDDNIPDFPVLEQELEKARVIEEAVQMAAAESVSDHVNPVHRHRLGVSAEQGTSP